MASFSLGAAKQDSLMSKYISFSNNLENIKKNAALFYINILFSILEKADTPTETLAVHALDEHLIKKIQFLRDNSCITPLGLHRAIRMLEEPMTEKNLQDSQNYKIITINNYKNKNNTLTTKEQTQQCFEKIITLCNQACNPGVGSRLSGFLMTSISGISLYNTLRSPWTRWSAIQNALYLGKYTLDIGSSFYSMLYPQNTPLLIAIENERIEFLEKVEKALDATVNIPVVDDNQESRTYQKLKILCAQDLCRSLAECIETQKATLIKLEKKPDTNDIKSGIEKAFAETKNQTITLCPNDKGDEFSKNLLIIKKSKTQPQDSLYDVAANIVCAHAFNVSLGDNMQKDAITMPFIDVYHLIVATKTYSSNKDFTYLQEIYIPLKTLSS